MQAPYTPSTLSILRRGLSEPWFLVLVPLALVIFAVLIGYHASDPSWTTSGTSPQVQHFAGKFGAYSADILLSFLGYAAYLMPLGMLAIAWAAAKQDINSGEAVLWKAVGLVAALISLSGILTFHCRHALNSVAVTGGGVIGQKISAELLAVMPVAYLMLIYTAVFLLALSLLFSLNWLNILGAIGYLPAKLLSALVQSHQERRETQAQTPLEPQQLQAKRQSILSRLKPRLREPSSTEVLISSEQAKAQMHARAGKVEPSLAGVQTEPQLASNMSFSEYMASLAAEREAAQTAAASNPAPEAPLSEQSHRSEPVLNWADYKHRDNSTPSVEPPVSTETHSADNSAAPAPQETAPVRLPNTASGQNPFAAFDAFAAHAPAPVETPAIPAAVEAAAVAAADKPLLDVIEEEEDFFADANRHLEAQAVAAIPTAAPMREEGNAAAKVRLQLGQNPFVPQVSSAGDYVLPSLNLLKVSPPKRTPDSASQFRVLAPLVESALQNYKLDVRVVGVDVGPVVTRLELELAAGIKVSQISNLDKDLARSLAVPSLRVVEVIPGKPYVGLEIPNKVRETVHLREILESPAYQQEKSPLTMVLGADIAGAPKVANLAKMPHLLVAGTTGSGKSVAINVMLASMLYKATPDELKLILIDPKMLEMSMYEDIPHLLTPVVTDMNDAENALRWAVAEMERRYMLMSAFKVRNIMGFNEVIREKQARGERIDDPLWKPEEHLGLANQPPQIDTLPYIVIVIDELADMMMAVGKKVEELIARIAQKARAAGIHLILATQRPSVDVITGLIKANVPTRLAFQVSSKIDSRTIIDGQGAETLLGHGDGLFVPPGSSAPMRVHGAFIEDSEVDALTAYIKTQGKPQYEESITSPVPASAMGAFGAQEKSDDPEQDPLYDEACQIAIESGKASISYLQRRLQIGYNRAARIVEAMEMSGLVTPADRSGNRKVIGGNQDY